MMMRREHVEVGAMLLDIAEHTFDRIGTMPNDLGEIDAKFRSLLIVGCLAARVSNAPRSRALLEIPSAVFRPHCSHGMSTSLLLEMSAAFSACANATKLASEKSEG
jgi:hypothetical protein